MQQLIINISDNSKISFIMELFNNFNFATVENKEIFVGDSEEEILENIKQGLKEAQLIKQGKLKSRPAKEFVNEL